MAKPSLISKDCAFECHAVLEHDGFIAGVACKARSLESRGTGKYASAKSSLTPKLDVSEVRQAMEARATYPDIGLKDCLGEISRTKKYGRSKFGSTIPQGALEKCIALELAVLEPRAMSAESGPAEIRTPRERARIEVRLARKCRGGKRNLARKRRGREVNGLVECSHGEICCCKRGRQRTER